MEYKHIGISLGSCCLPANWGVANNYRETRADNYKTCPFDLMISNYNGMVQCILDDFKNFTDPQFLKYDRNHKICIKNNYYNFTFNHESPDHGELYKNENWEEGKYHYTNNNYKNLIERYNNRISNFQSYLSDEKNFITFIICFCEKLDIDYECIELREALLLKYPKLCYKIIIIEGPHPHIVGETKIIKIIEKEK